MKRLMKSVLLVAVFTMLFASVAQAEPGDKLMAILQKEAKPVMDLIPSDYQKSDKFMPGAGAPVGTVELVMGEAYVMHKNVKTAYKLQRDDGLFQGDSVVTLTASKLQAKLNDMTGFALGANSKFTLDSVVYDAAKGQRNTLVSMAIGRARIVATKVKESRGDDYQIKTPTANIGIRGSDFLVGVVTDEELNASRTSWFANLFVSEARAQAMLMPGWATIVGTGPSTTVGMVGGLGSMQTLTSLTASMAIAGQAASAPLAISAAAFSGAAGAIGGTAASMEMPRRY